MFVHTITSVQNPIRPIYTYSQINNEIKLVELLFSDTAGSRAVFGIRPALKLDMRQSVSQTDFMFCKNGVDIIAGRVPDRISLRESARLSKNVINCVELGNPMILLLYGRNAEYLSALHRSLFSHGYHIESQNANGMQYLAVVKTGMDFLFPRESEMETMMGAHLRRAIHAAKSRVCIKGGHVS